MKGKKDEEYSTPETYQIQLCLILLYAGQGHAKEMVEGLPLFGWLREAFLRR